MSIHLAPGGSEPVTHETLRADLVRRRDAAVAKLTAHMELVKHSERELGEIDAALVAHDLVVGALFAEVPPAAGRAPRRNIKGLVLAALPGSKESIVNKLAVPAYRIDRALDALMRDKKVSLDDGVWSAE